MPPTRRESLLEGADSCGAVHRVVHPGGLCPDVVGSTSQRRLFKAAYGIDDNEL